MPKAAAAVTRFAGFADARLSFFRALARHQDREWFLAHKEEYEQGWHHPMVALLTEAREKLDRVYRHCELAEPKVMRIHRDVRFSKDKSPYKTHVAGAIPVAGAKTQDGGCTALYLHLGLDEEFIGVGTYFFADTQLAKWRKLVAADKTGKQIAAIVGKLRAAGYAVGGHDDYKKVPKPYADDHPRAEFLKMRGLTGGFPEIPRGLLHDAGFADWLVEHGKKTAPLVTWLATNVK